MNDQEQQLIKSLLIHGSKYDNYIKEGIKPITPISQIVQDHAYIKTFDPSRFSEGDRKILEDSIKAHEYIINNYDNLKFPSWAVKPYETEDELEVERENLQKKMKKLNLGSNTRKAVEDKLYKTNYLINHYDELPNTALENAPSVSSSSVSLSSAPSTSSNRKRINDETIELKLRNIVNKDIPKYITIDGQKYYISRAALQYIKSEEEKNGGFLPLLPLIFGGLAAAGSIAGGSAAIAQAVNRKKAEDAASKEQKRHNKAMESFARGNGLFLNPPGQGDGLKEAIKDLAKRSGLEEGSKRLLKNTLYNLADSVNLEPKGNGLFLSPKV